MITRRSLLILMFYIPNESSKRGVVLIYLNFKRLFAVTYFDCVLSRSFKGLANFLPCLCLDISCVSRRSLLCSSFSYSIYKFSAKSYNSIYKFFEIMNQVILT